MPAVPANMPPHRSCNALHNPDPSERTGAGPSRCRCCARWLASWLVQRERLALVVLASLSGAGGSWIEHDTSSRFISLSLCLCLRHFFQASDWKTGRGFRRGFARQLAIPFQQASFVPSLSLISRDTFSPAQVPLDESTMTTRSTQCSSGPGAPRRQQIVLLRLRSPIGGAGSLPDQGGGSILRLCLLFSFLCCSSFACDRLGCVAPRTLLAMQSGIDSLPSPLWRFCFARFRILPVGDAGPAAVNCVCVCVLLQGMCCVAGHTMPSKLFGGGFAV
ncbi:hypothetical protein Micbo1qcDRAFT_23130 [Microdochium bolleyi]|uniref:Uncharacterized protein n=1 Tax=Microdochium bolleyi TaxID=196109 RepID=A0A136IQY6_9PEZI|nr:hypothetical protein Micbo1qcDRAFT_23130 [Microdochium bolleyi]